MRAVRGVARGADDNGIAVVNNMTGHVAHSRGRSRWIVAGPAHRFQFLIVGIEAPARRVAVIAGNLVAWIVWGQLGNGGTGRE